MQEKAKTTRRSEERKPEVIRDYRAEITEAGVTREQLRARLSAYVLGIDVRNRTKSLRSARKFTEWFEGEGGVKLFAQKEEMSTFGFRAIIHRLSAVAINPAYDEVENPEGDIIELAIQAHAGAHVEIHDEDTTDQNSGGEVIQSNDFSWRNHAACAKNDPEMFFPEKGGPTADAKRICNSCDVREKCLQYALDNRQLFGIWGGKSAQQRKKMLEDAGVGLNFSDVAINE